MIAAPAHRRMLALVFLALLATAPLGVARAAWADTAPTGGSGSTVSQINKAFALFFLALKLAEIASSLDLPSQGGPPDPVWGSHPDPLPVGAPDAG